MTKARDLANGGFGLVLVKPSTVVGGTDNGKGTVSFSAATGISLNGCFNSTYTNYRVILNIQGTSVYQDVTFRLRVSAADASGSNYTIFGMYVDSVSSPTKFATTNGTSLNLADSGTGGGVNIFDVSNPFDAIPTIFTGTRSNATTANTGYQVVTYGARHSQSISYDGFTLTFPQSSTGTVSVYGYNK
jgi:hypothetical protein